MQWSEAKKAKHLLLGHTCLNCRYSIGIQRCLTLTRDSPLPKELICDDWKLPFK